VNGLGLGTVSMSLGTIFRRTNFVYIPEFRVPNRSREHACVW